MTVPTNITDPPMGHTEQESHLESKEEEHFIPMHLIQHVFQTVMGLCIDGQLESYPTGYNSGNMELLMTCMMIFTITQL